MTNTYKWNAITWTDHSMRMGLHIVVASAIILAISTRRVLPLVISIIVVGGVEWARKQGFYLCQSQTDGFRPMEESAPFLAATSSSSSASKNPTMTIGSQTYHGITAQNPLGNVLITDIHDSPQRLSAPPAFNPHVSDVIVSAAKEEFPVFSSDKTTYGGMYENYEYNKTFMRNFYSTASTSVSNDQGAFAQWLYGNAPSSKENTIDGALMRINNTARHILR